MELNKDTESLEATIRRHQIKAKRAEMFKDTKSAKEHQTKVIELEKRLEYLNNLKASL